MNLHRTSVLIAPVVILLLFGTTLVGIDRFAFRDVSHFYTPLYDYVAERTSEAWLPLWNPLDQTGIPLLGETTTAVLYPVRYLLFSLPISSATALAWYIAGHLVLASSAARWAARQSQAGPWAATIAGVIYPLSGSVLFLSTNPPFLVGAAWLPLVLGALLARNQLATISRCLIAGPAMAMMILGGDPQIALHAMLVALIVGIVRGWKSTDIDVRRSIVTTLLGAPVLAAALTAPQLAASVSWSSRSERLQAVDPQAWYEPPVVGSQRSNAFQFSLPPWHTLELLTPNAYGELFPEHRRVSSIIRGDGRMWTPSIYLGLFSIVAILGQLLRRQLDAWLALAIVSLLLCFGHFGFVWCVQQIPGVAIGVDSAIGGCYWWLYQCFPGYDSFRYPTKWLPLFSLAAAITSAHWIDAMDWLSARRPMLMVGVLLLLGSAAVALLRWQWHPQVSLADAYWGPLDLASGMAQIQRSLVHSLVVLAAVVLIVRRWSANSQWLCLLLVMVVAVDLGWGNHRYVAVVSRSKEQSRLEQHRRFHPIPPAYRWLRTQSSGGWPTTWRAEADPRRMMEVAVSERLAWFGRWHLYDRAAVINNMTSIQSHDMAEFWNAVANVSTGKTPGQRRHLWQSLRRWLAIDGVLKSTGKKSNEDPGDGEIVDVSFVTQATDDQLFRFVDQWRVSREDQLDEFVSFLNSVDQHDGLPIPLIQSAAPPAAAADERKLEYRIEPISRDELSIQTSRLGLLTRAVYQDGHWIANIKPAGTQSWQATTVHQVSFLKQGLVLKPGHWHIRFEYRPRWLIWTLVTSAIAWITWAAIVLHRYQSRRAAAVGH